MDNFLIETTRGSLRENVYRGHIAVVDRHNKLLASVGDANYVTYMRSAAKPLQAVPAVESGALERFSIDEAELAVMCGSHIGAAEQTAAVDSILHKLGLSEAALTLGADLSYNHGLREQRLVAGIAPRKLYNCCSGKHACMLALCRYYGWPTADYQREQHPVQQLMRDTVASFAELPPQALIVGVDGCGVSVFALPLINMALAYRNLTNPSQFLPSKRAAAAQRITDAMAQHPQMVAGDGCFCTELIRVTQGRIIGKLGSDGVYCCAPRGSGIGIALKMEDGAASVMPLAVVSVLRQLDLLSHEEMTALSHFARRDNLNCQQDVIGETRPVFILEESR